MLAGPQRSMDSEAKQAGLAILALLLLAVALYAATVPSTWYLIAAVLFFSGLLGLGFTPLNH